MNILPLSDVLVRAATVAARPVLASLCLMVAVGAGFAAAQREPGHRPGMLQRASPDAVQPAEAGEWCLVCRSPVAEGGLVLLHRGRRVPLHTGVCLEEWTRNSEMIFTSLQPRGALFQELSVPASPLAGGWFLLGLYVLAGLVVGASCGYLAVARGLAPIPWFFAGLGLNVAALAGLLTRPRADLSKLPAGVPAGLSKVPTTRPPRRCLKCGSHNHPAASRCTDCGASMEPLVEAETQRVK
ncbi:MAG: hypothetical protein V3U98_11510 [Acidobacteriota bacterium]